MGNILARVHGFADLIQEGNLALLKAVHLGFDGQALFSGNSEAAQTALQKYRQYQMRPRHAEIAGVSIM